MSSKPSFVSEPRVYLETETRMTILSQLREWLDREAQRWVVPGKRAQTYRLKSDVIVYWHDSDKIGFWGLNGNVVQHLNRSGLPWKAVLVSSHENLAFVVDGRSDLVKSLTPSKRGYYLLHENSELKNVNRLNSLAQIINEISAESTAGPSIPDGERRKYGAGGEGADHRKLKQWVLEHPEEIGFERVLRKHSEYAFVTGDKVDLLFDLRGNRHAVVEIETDNPTPGVHQALKYKVLKCAEIGSDIKSDKVEAILVAWTAPDTVFCERYNVRFVKIKL